MPRKRRFYTVKEAAVELGLTESTIRSAIHNGKIEAHKIGARLNIIDHIEVERYRQERLGTQGWDKRRAPEYRPSRMAQWAKNYRARKKEKLLPG
ncbi:MAG TPA: helix-turn-helix domain-containing protein [Ktedonobacteraceae bacterium]|nr:helix-turn-helix domain-containing protein [Ktedonobacteraceae bacterium]